MTPDHTVKLDRVGADVPIVRRHGSSFRRLTLMGSDGSQRHFIVQTSLTPNARSDERILQLFRVMNRMFDKHKESRRRHICIHTPIIIPVWSQVIVFCALVFCDTQGVVSCGSSGKRKQEGVQFFRLGFLIRKIRILALLSYFMVFCNIFVDYFLLTHDLLSALK